VKSVCRFKLRAHLEGFANTTTFETLFVEAKTNGLSVVDADPAVRTMFDSMSSQINAVLPGLINGEINKALTQEVEKLKVTAEEGLTSALSDDKNIFGDYAEYVSMKSFIENSTEFIAQFLPTASVKMVETDDKIDAEVQLQEFEGHLVEHVCKGASSWEYFWLRLLPFGLLSAALAWKYPRGAAVVFCVGLFLASTYASGWLCRQVAPSVSAKKFLIKAKMPEEIAATDGGIDVLNVEVSHDDSGHLVARTALTRNTIEEMLKGKIIEIDNMDGKLPVSIVDGNVELRPEDHILHIEPTSYVDVGGSVDLSCTPLPQCILNSFIGSNLPIGNLPLR